jgi:hypothetical protein
MTDLVDDPRILEVKAAWTRMDAPAAAHVLGSTTWSYLTDDLDPAASPAEPMGEWDLSTSGIQSTEERASNVAWNILSHDPRFAEQIKRLYGDPFSEDFREFIFLVVQESAAAGALYAKHFDRDRAMTADRLARATAALMGVELLADQSS